MHRIELTEIDRKKISELGKIKTPSLWQPIETAPKDGTEVDLWARPYTGSAMRLCSMWWTDSTGWRSDVRNPYTEEIANKGATHWMFLPEPPK